MNEDEKGFEMISNTIEYYTRLQRIKDRKSTRLNSSHNA